MHHLLKLYVREILGHITLLRDIHTWRLSTVHPPQQEIINEQRYQLSFYLWVASFSRVDREMQDLESEKRVFEVHPEEKHFVHLER